jgi:hypothetical protein
MSTTASYGQRDGCHNQGPRWDQRFASSRSSQLPTCQAGGGAGVGVCPSEEEAQVAHDGQDHGAGQVGAPGQQLQVARNQLAALGEGHQAQEHQVAQLTATTMI